MKAKNIIEEVLDTTGLEAQIAVLKKNYQEIDKAIKENPLLVKTYANQINGMNASMSALDKQLAILAQQKTQQQQIEQKQKQMQQQNVGTTKSLAQQANPPKQQAVSAVAPATTTPVAPKL